MNGQDQPRLHGTLGKSGYGPKKGSQRHRPGPAEAWLLHNHSCKVSSRFCQNVTRGRWGRGKITVTHFLDVPPARGTLTGDLKRNSQIHGEICSRGIFFRSAYEVVSHSLPRLKLKGIEPLIRKCQRGQRRLTKRHSRKAGKYTAQ